MNEKKALSKSVAVISKTMNAAMKLLKENGGSMSFQELKKRIEETVEFTEWELSTPSEKTNKPRWELNMAFYSIDYIKAGFLSKDSGVWYLTPEGEKMLAQSPEKIFAAAHTAYRISKRENAKYEQIDEDIKDITEPTASELLEEAEAKAMDGLREYVRSMDWQDFQKLVAALLHAMGYYVPFVAPQGPDGGIDVLAYERDSGAGQRLFVQAKRFHNTNVGVDVVRNLAALLHKDSDIGMVVTSGRFTSEALRFAQSCKYNLRLVDLAELIKLWIAYYDRLTPSERAYMPIQPIYFLIR